MVCTMIFNTKFLLQGEKTNTFEYENLQYVGDGKCVIV